MILNRSRFLLALDQGRGGNTPYRLALILYLNHPTKLDVTSGQIGAQQPVSAKSNDEALQGGFWCRLLRVFEPACRLFRSKKCRCRIFARTANVAVGT